MDATYLLLHVYRQEFWSGAPIEILLLGRVSTLETPDH